jgi:hypothetical protein
LAPVARALDGVDGIDRYLVDEWIRAVDRIEHLERVIQQTPLVRGSQGKEHPSSLWRKLLKQSGRDFLSSG